MNGEIKFRVVNNGKIIGYEKIGEAGWQWTSIELNPKEFERWCIGVFPPSSTNERDPFIGVLDKKGKQIYNSDIIKCGDEIMLVSWSKKYASFCLDKKGWAFLHWFGEAVDPDKCEIIGNLHENPDLLK